MVDYVITFFTHYDAINCSRKLKKNAIPSKMSPVPRVLSSSCGTCLYFSQETSNNNEIIPLIGDEFEQLFQSHGDCYTLIMDNRG